MNYHVFPLFPRDHRDWQTEDEHPVFAKDHKDVPDWLKAHRQWEQASDVNKLEKRQLKVKMCCAKCEEIILEKIREVRGVFDVRAERREKKVVVVAMPGGFDEHEVLKKARKVHRKARYVELDAKEKQKPKGDNKTKDKDDHDDHDHQGGHGHGQDNRGGGGGGGGGGGKGKNKNKSELQANPSQSISGVAQLPWGQQFWPLQAAAPRYYYGPPSHTQFFPDPRGQFVYFI